MGAGASAKQPPGTPEKRAAPADTGLVRSFRPETEPQLYLTWHEPYGEPGASSALHVSCDDTTGVDTLYLSFDPGRFCRGVVSVSGVLLFHPCPGDSLADFWSFKRGSANEGGLLVDFANILFPCYRPWEGVPSRSAAYYDKRSGRGRLDLFCWIPAERSSSVFGGSVYCFARMRIDRRRAHLRGCARPVALEWAAAYINCKDGKEIQIRRGAHRFATWNVPGGRPWTTQSPLARAWQPRYEVPPSWVGK